MITYIAEIYEYGHHDFQSSQWSNNPCNKILRKLSICGSQELATKLFEEWCKEYTDHINQFREQNYPNYNKWNDESVFKVHKVYSVDSIKNI